MARPRRPLADDDPRRGEHVDLTIEPSHEVYPGFTTYPGLSVGEEVADQLRRRRRRHRHAIGVLRAMLERLEALSLDSKRSADRGLVMTLVACAEAAEARWRAGATAHELARRVAYIEDAIDEVFAIETDAGPILRAKASAEEVAFAAAHVRAALVTHDEAFARISLERLATVLRAWPTAGREPGPSPTRYGLACELLEAIGFLPRRG